MPSAKTIREAKPACERCDMPMEYRLNVNRWTCPRNPEHPSLSGEQAVVRAAFHARVDAFRVRRSA